MSDDAPQPLEPPRLRALPQAQPTDGELIERSVGDPDCFATLFDRHAATGTGISAAGSVTSRTTCSP